MLDEPKTQREEQASAASDPHTTRSITAPPVADGAATTSAARPPAPDRRSGPAIAAEVPQVASAAATLDGGAAGRRPSVRSPANRTAKKHVILFLAANPHDTGRLALDREARAIHVELKRSGYRDRFEFVTRWAAEPLDLLRELRELKPTIVHFSGHGGPPASTSGLPASRDVVAATGPAGDAPNGVVFDGANGRSQWVTPEAIARTFGALGARVRLVVLNACYTAAVAEALRAHVDCVVGMTGAIHDDAARSFATGLYGGLGEHESIAAAFEQGKAAIYLDGLPDADRPQLQVRDGFDAAELILAAMPSPVPIDVPCPYPGMRPFAADNAGSFHGREAEIGELIGRLRAGQREIFVIGPSGSGKSSLVAAGVLPRLARGLSGIGPFVVRQLRPGDQPLARLGQALDAPTDEPLDVVARVAALLARRGPGASLLVLVDQLEELFAQASAVERAAFLDALGALRTESRCAVIYTLRADFSGALMESPLWPERPAQLPRVDLVPLRGKALRDAITAPAQEVGATVEPELTERLVADAASEPGILPLLQETLVQLWDARADHALTLADYQALGDGERSGLAVSLARRADATLQRFNAAQTAVARRILLRLVSFGEGRSDTRRQQPRAQLHAAGEFLPDFDNVLQTMVDHRLLTIDEDPDGEARVDLAHEIVLSAWPRLAGWIRAHQDDEQHRRRLEVAAAEWVQHGRGARGLLDPLELMDADQWRQTDSASQVGQSVDVEALIIASRAEQIKRRINRRRLVLLAFMALVIFAFTVSAMAISTLRDADTIRETWGIYAAESGRRLLAEGKYEEAVTILLNARRHGIPEESISSLFDAARRQQPLRDWHLYIGGHSDASKGASFSRDRTRFVTWRLGSLGENNAQVFDAATGNPVGHPLEHLAEVVSAEFSPDGTRVVTASRDKTARLWDATTGEGLFLPLKHRADVTNAAFSHDGTRVATASSDKTARVWDAATGELLTGPLEHQAEVARAELSPDGTRVVTMSLDGTARVWDVRTGSLLTRSLERQAWLESATFSPDGARLLITSLDHALLWDVAADQPLTKPLEHGTLRITAKFSSDGTHVVTSDDDTTCDWNATTGALLSSSSPASACGGDCRAHRPLPRASGGRE